VEPKSKLRIFMAEDKEPAMTSVDPWEKAADCERGLVSAADPKHRPVLEKVRDLWVALANKQSLMSPDDVAKEVETINRIHIALVSKEQSERLH
jgi:hypothetical protein